MIKIIAIGKKHDDWTAAGVDRYSKRLRRPWNVEWIFIAYSAQNGATARQDESERILNKLSDGDCVVLLDERGKLFDSPALSRELSTQLDNSRPVVLVIGGAYGVNDALYKRANVVWSLSPLVFPHQLVRLLAIEQIYRAQEIATGKPYHHE